MEDLKMKITDLKRYIILSAAPLSITDGEVPEEILVFAYGQTQFTKDGKEDFYVFSESDADTLIAAFARKGVDGLVDYEHQMLRSLFNGKEVPAAAWIKKLIKKPDGLWCLVSWTPRARGYLEDCEYKYISPVFRVSRTGKNITELFNISLTGRPSTNNQPALIAADDITEGFDGCGINQPQRGNSMHKLLTMLGLTALSDSEDQTVIDNGIESAVQKLLDGQKEATDFLALHDASDFDAITQKINDGKKEVADFLALHDAESLTALTEDLKKKGAEAAVQDAIDRRKLTEAKREDGLALALSDMDMFKRQYDDKAPDVVPDNKELGNLDNPNKDTQKLTALSDVQIDVLQKMGFSEEKIQEAAKEINNQKGA
jgi:phage I-like protein